MSRVENKFNAYYAEIIRREWREATKLDYGVGIHVTFHDQDEVIVVTTKPVRDYQPKSRQPTKRYVFQIGSDDDEFVFVRGKGKDREVVRFPLPIDYTVENPINPSVEDCEKMLAGDRIAWRSRTSAKDIKRIEERDLARGNPPKATSICGSLLMHHIYKHHKRLLDEGMIWYDPTEDTDNPTYCMPDFGSMTDKFADYAWERGLYHNPCTGDYFINPERVGEVYKVAQEIMEEYDASTATTHWKDFELGGDDDVDYNGGHVMAGIELLQDYLKHRGE